MIVLNATTGRTSIHRARKYSSPGVVGASSTGPSRASAPRAARVTGILADAATEAGAASVLAAARRIDVLVNNLGIRECKPFAETTDVDWRTCRPLRRIGRRLL